MSAESMADLTEVTLATATRKAGMHGLALIDHMSRKGYRRADVSGALAHLYAHGRIDIDGSHHVWPRHG